MKRRKHKGTEPWYNDPKYFFFSNNVGRYVPGKTMWVMDRRRHWLNKYNQSKGCEHCGYNSDPRALQFDHIEPLLKSFSIKSKEGLTKPLKVLIEEVRKCRTLCANCHVIKTTDEGDRKRPTHEHRKMQDYNNYHRKDA